MKVSVLFVVIALFACTVSGAVAAVFAVDTSQTWMFDTEMGSSTPNPVDNPFGSPTAFIDVDENGTGYYDTMPEVYGSAQGWWDIGTGSITLTIPNRPNAGLDTYKEITVWIKYWDDINGAPEVLVAPTPKSFGVTTEWLEDGPMGGSWMADTWTFRIEPNPDFETITILGNFMGSQIDEIYVTTICAPLVPEPSSILALCSGLLGAAGFVVRRKRA